MLDGGMRSVAMRSVTTAVAGAVATAEDCLAANAGLAVAKIIIQSVARILMPYIALFFPFLYIGKFWHN
jgi:hypothetical protein